MLIDELTFSGIKTLHGNSITIKLRQPQTINYRGIHRIWKERENDRVYFDRLFPAQSPLYYHKPLHGTVQYGSNAAAERRPASLLCAGAAVGWIAIASQV